MGKTEDWYIVEAFEGANIVVGMKDGRIKEKFQKAIEIGRKSEGLKVEKKGIRRPILR